MNEFGFNVFEFNGQPNALTSSGNDIGEPPVNTGGGNTGGNNGGGDSSGPDCRIWRQVPQADSGCDWVQVPLDPL